MKPINLSRKLATFSDHWSPKTVANFNGHDVMVVKVKGGVNWHSHSDTDDFFLVHLKQGEMFVVPKGVEHCPVAEEEAELLLIEPTGTPNTGDPTTAAKQETI